MQPRNYQVSKWSYCNTEWQFKLKFLKETKAMDMVLGLSVNLKMIFLLLAPYAVAIHETNSTSTYKMYLNEYFTIEK